MTFDLQRANVWKRISAFLFDVILLAIACVLCAWGLSALLGFDAQYQTLMTRYQTAADACGLDMSIMTQTYSTLTDAQRALVEQANAVLAADETAVHAYGMVIQLSILIVSFGVLSGYLLLEFLVPLLFKNGQTLGKKIFGVALMRNDGVRIGHVTLFVRTVLGKYAVETMIPIMAVMMLFFGNLNIVVLGIVLIFASVVSVLSGRVIDRLGELRCVLPAAGVMFAGLLGMFFARSMLAVILTGCIMMSGYMLVTAILSGVIRDHTPAGKAGHFQGIRMIFGVLLPMIFGPAIGAAVIRGSDSTYVDLGVVKTVPTPSIFLAAAIVLLLILPPVLALKKKEGTKC